MKVLILTLISAIALTACGDAQQDIDNTSNLGGGADIVQSVEVVPDNTVTPVSAKVETTDEVSVIAPIIEAPFKVRDTAPSPLEPICSRDNTPLIDLGNYLIDNCGNKYGKTQ
jgi:hypothetical protein